MAPSLGGGGGFKAFGGGRKPRSKDFAKQSGKGQNNDFASRPRSGGGHPSSSAGRGFKPVSGGVAKKSGGKPVSLKNQIRALERLLRKEGLDPRVHAAKTAELAELQKGVGSHAQAERERKYAVRYHKIKFFERVKLERAAKQLRKGAEGRALTDEENAKLQQLEADLQYVLHFPKGEKYVSIIKQAEDPADQAALEVQRARLRRLVLAQLRETAAVTEADEGRGLMESAAAAALAAAATVPPTAGRVAAAVATYASKDMEGFDLPLEQHAHGCTVDGRRPLAGAEVPPADSAKRKQQETSAVPVAGQAGKKPKHQQPSALVKVQMQHTGQHKRPAPAAVLPQATAAAGTAADDGDQDDFFIDAEEGVGVDEAAAATASAFARLTGADADDNLDSDGERDAVADGPPVFGIREKHGRDIGLPDNGQRKARNSLASGASRNVGKVDSKGSGIDRAGQTATAAGGGVLGTPVDAAGVPVRSRAEGGRKRRKRGAV